MRPLYGLGLGFFAGAGLAALVGLSSALGGDGSGLPAGVTRLELMALYVVGGSIGGLLFGLALPLARTLLGSMLVGVVAVGPYFLAQAYLQSSHLGGLAFYDATLMIALFAVVGGLVGRTQNRSQNGST